MIIEMKQQYFSMWYRNAKRDNNWNVCQYAALVHMIAQVSGLEAGELVHVIADCHIYDRHVDLVKKMLDNPTFEAPKFEIDPTVNDFYAFTKDSFRMVDYKCNKFDYEIPIAI